MVGSSFWLQYRASGCGIGVSVVVGTISPPPPVTVYEGGLNYGLHMYIYIIIVIIIIIISIVYLLQSGGGIALHFWGYIADQVAIQSKGHKPS